MIKKKLAIILCLAFIAQLLTACSHLPGTVDRSHTSRPAAAQIITTTSGHIQKKVSDTINIDADITAPTDYKKAKTLSIVPYIVDDQKLTDSLLGSSKITKHTATSVKAVNFNTYDHKSMLYATDDGKTVSREFNSIFFITDESGSIDVLFCWPTSPWADLDAKFSKTADLPFMLHNDAVKAVKDTLLTLGIETAGRCDSYSFDHPSLKKAEDWTVANTPNLQNDNPSKGEDKPKGTWTGDDDCYSFTFYSAIDGVELNSEQTGKTSGGAIVDFYGSAIDVLYSKRGILELHTGGIFKAKDKEKQQGAVMGVNDALQLAKKHFDGLLLGKGTEATITDILFCYTPRFTDTEHNTAEVVPTWQFKYKINGDSVTSSRSMHTVAPGRNVLPKNYVSAININAVDGSEMS